MDSVNIAQISSSCIQLLTVLSAEPLHSVSVLILFNKRWHYFSLSHIITSCKQRWLYGHLVQHVTITIDLSLYESYLCLYSFSYFHIPPSFRDMPCTMSLIEINSLFRMDDIIASATQPVTILEVSAVSGRGLQEVLSWLESITVKWTSTYLCLKYVMWFSTRDSTKDVGVLSVQILFTCHFFWCVWWWTPRKQDKIWEEKLITLVR